jgi:hypothetical protein
MRKGFRFPCNADMDVLSEAAVKIFHEYLVMVFPSPGSISDMPDFQIHQGCTLLLEKNGSLRINVWSEWHASMIACAIPSAELQ